MLTLGLPLACGAPAPDAAKTLRVVDAFESGMVSGASSGAEAPEPAAWTFSEGAAGWAAHRGVEGFAPRAGRLEGESADEVPILLLDRGKDMGHEDLLHEIEVRLRVSAGSNLAIHFVGAEPNEIDQVVLSGLAAVPWLHQTPLVAGGEMTTYRFAPMVPVKGDQIHKIALKVTDTAGARFAVESVKITFRGEHLASIPSGVSWQGLSEVYRETVVTRVPETLTWPLTLPPDARLGLDLGTLDDRPVTFRIALEAAGRKVPLLERTVTRPDRWDPADLDLGRWAGSEVRLALSLDGAEGALGLWGSPTVRGGGPRAASASPNGHRPPRGVVLILADTLRPERLDAYGHGRSTAPTIRALARGGTLFADAVAQASWTKVSVPSMLSSLYPTTSGVRDVRDRLPGSATTLAEVFRAAGYTTVGYSSVPFTGRFSNLHQGYEELHERAFDPGSSKTARDFVDRLLPWLDRHHESPFFAFVHVFDPHSPFEPSAPYAGLWLGSDQAEEHRRNAEVLRGHIGHPLRALSGMGWSEEFVAAGLDAEAYMERDLAWYDASIRAMDTEIGRVMERLRELGIADDTLVVFTSDHGEEFLDHGRTFHGQSVYGELTRVPMILHWPGAVPAGVEIGETVQLLDLYPTVLELCGLDAPAEAQGQSAVPLLAAAAGGDTFSTARPWRPVPAVSEKTSSTSKLLPPPRDTEAFGMVYDGWKLIHNVVPEHGAPTYELYDHEADPFDQNDLAAEKPQVVERLAALLHAWHKEAVARRLPDDEETAQSMSAEDLQRLRALGYVE